jgi:folate-binding protein YgfZ
MLIALPPPQLLEIAGTDAVVFAHAQFCNDVRALANGHWQWNAWLSPQGRVRAFFHLLRDGDERLRLLLRGGGAESLREALARFVFRAKVQLGRLSNVQVAGIEAADELPLYLDTTPLGTELVSSDGVTGLVLPGTTPRWLLLRQADASPIATAALAEALNRWRLADIRAGLSELVPSLHEQLLPQWLGLDRLDAVNMRKGCYPGQEIMARLHFKGGNKRGLYRLEFHADVLPPPATALFVRDAAAVESIGVVVMSAWSAQGRGEALGVLAEIPIDTALRSADAAAHEIKVISRFS